MCGGIEMKITIDMPWERNLTVNHCRMGPIGNWHLKPHVEGWMDRLGWEVFAAWSELGRPELLPTAKDPLYVVLDCRFANKAERDAENYFYVVANAVAAGLRLDNDQHVRTRAGEVVVDRENPGFTITITDEEGADDLLEPGGADPAHGGGDDLPEHVGTYPLR